MKQHCPFCGKPATVKIPSSKVDMVCVEHAEEFWAAVVHLGTQNAIANRQPVFTEDIEQAFGISFDEIAGVVA